MGVCFYMFWTRFIELCSKVGKSPNAVAAACGVKSSGTVTGWSNGSIPRAPILHKLADYFHVTADYLLGNVSGPFFYKIENGGQMFDLDLYLLSEIEIEPVPVSKNGNSDNALEQEFMRWFRMQSPDRQKEVLFCLAKAVSEHSERSDDQDTASGKSVPPGYSSREELEREADQFAAQAAAMAREQFLSEKLRASEASSVNASDAG